MIADSTNPLTELMTTLKESGITGPDTDLESNVSLIVNVALFLAFGVSFVMFAVAMVQLATSTGDPKRVEKPRDALTWSVVGMVLSLALLTLKKVFLNLLGVDVW